MRERVLARVLGIAVAALLGAGCAKPVVRPLNPVFFPPSPAPPRIQFLATFTGRNDLDEQSAFDKFIVGARPDVRIDKAYGIAAHDGKLYVCDTNSTVFVFDIVNRVLSPLPGAVGPGALHQPVNITIDREGNKYVADPVRGQVVVYDRKDAYTRAYGLPGDWRPVDVAPFEDRVYILDAQHASIRVFDKETGNFIKAIGNSGDPSERLDRPTNLVFDRDGYLYVTDFGRFEILKFDRDGHLKARFGRPGDNLGHFARPKGIAVDHDGRVYAADASFNNIQIFNAKGRLLMFFGEGGNNPGGLVLPAKVAIDYDNIEAFRPYYQPDFEPEYLIYVTSQFGEHRINVYAFGKQKGQTYPSDAELEREIEERRKKEMGE